MKTLRAHVLGEIPTDRDRLGAAWQALDRASAPNVFLTFEWVAAWWRALGDGRAAYLVVVEDEAGEVVGIAPLTCSVARPGRIARVTTLRFMGDPQADRLGFLSLAGLETDVARAIADLLRGRDDWDVLRLANLPADSPELAALSSAFQRDHVVLREPGLACPYLPIEGDWETYLRSRQKRFRVGLRHDQQLLAAELGARMKTCREPEEVRTALAFLFEHNVARFASGDGTVSGFADPRVQAFHLDLAPRLLATGRLACSVLEADGAIAAVDYDFCHGGKLWGYNAAFDARFAPYGVGRALLGWVIQRAFEEGIHEYDFLLGDYDYKRRWATHAREHWELRVVRQRPAAVAAAALPVWWSRARRSIKRALPEPVVRAARRALGRPDR